MAQGSIYVASSWRNPVQPAVVKNIRAATDWAVYDFRADQVGGARGFHWSEIDPDWETWTGQQFLKGLDHKLAQRGFKADMEALEGADATLLVLPCGKSAHLELGCARGAKQETAIYIPQDLLNNNQVVEPELMYKMVDQVMVSMDQVLLWVRRLKGGKHA